TEAHARRLKVCAFSFNGPEELEVFKSRLPADEFELLDLSPRPRRGPSAAPPPEAGSSDSEAPPWLPPMCGNDLQCDLVVFSAEFAGRFFGRSGQSLSLQEMEEASCQARCTGLFHSPREVFLLGCNTLATKDEDQRTPAQYLQVLIDHGFDR